MRVIIIDAKKREIREEDIKGDLASLQEVVGGYIELVRYSDQEDVYVNEAGLLHGEQNFFSLRGFLQPLAGNAVIIGSSEEGRQEPTKLTLEEVRKNVSFASLAELQLGMAKLN